MVSKYKKAEGRMVEESYLSNSEVLDQDGENPMKLLS